MGITAASASFHGDLPSLEAIVARIEALSGLALAVESRPQETMFRFNANIAFACIRRERIDVYAYAPGIPTFRDTILTTPGVDELARHNPQVSKMIDAWRTAPAPDPDVTHVHTRGYVGEEGTLHDFVVIALESLGGVPTRPMSAERRARCATLTPRLLRARHRQHVRFWIAELLKAPVRLLIAAWRRTP